MLRERQRPALQTFRPRVCGKSGRTLRPPSSDGERRWFAGLFFPCPLVPSRRQFLVANCPDTSREAIKSNEARGIALLVHIIFAESDKPLVVERKFAVAAYN